MVTATTKYTCEILKPLLQKAYSFYELARLVGIAPTGSNTTNLKRRCVEYGLDMSHMTGQRHREGKISNTKKHFSLVLIEGNLLDRRKEVSKLRRAMIESGIEYKCECGLINTWNENHYRCILIIETANIGIIEKKI